MSDLRIPMSDGMVEKLGAMSPSELDAVYSTARLAADVLASGSHAPGSSAETWAILGEAMGLLERIARGAAGFARPADGGPACPTRAELILRNLMDKESGADDLAAQVAATASRLALGGKGGPLDE